MALVGAAAVGAAGSIGAAALSRKSGGGGGGVPGGGGGAVPAGIDTGAFAFNTVNPEFSGGRGTLFQLRRTGSPAQRALAARFPRSLTDLDTLRDTLTPGFSDLREARLKQIENARRRAIGNLQENLQRRRVLGSSFGADAIARQQLAFAEASSQVEAQSFLEEVDANIQLIGQEAALLQDAFKRDIAEFSLAAEFGAALLGIGGQNARLAAQLESEAAQAAAEGQGRLLGSLTGNIAGAFRTKALIDALNPPKGTT